MKLEEILKNYTKEELQTSLTYLGLFFNEQDDEKALQNMIKSYLLDSDNVRKIFEIIPTYSFEKIFKEGKYEASFNEDIRFYNEIRVYSLGFGDSKKVELPLELIEAAKAQNLNQLLKDREKQLWVYSCVNFANTFYGIYNFDVLEKLIIQNTRIHLSKTELKTRFLDLPQSVACEYFDQANMIVNRTYGDQIKDILDKQGNKPFYIPSYKEINEFFLNGYINNVYYDLAESYKAYLNEGLGLEYKILMFNQLATNYDNLDELFRGFYNNTKFETISLEKECKNNFINMALTTRNLYNRGFSSNDLRNLKRQ